jgi:hypothetical protein
LADAVLTGNPQVTFWRFVARSYTNFALESQLLDYTAGQAYFGGYPKCNLDRIGDLVYWMYAVFDLPGIGAKDPTNAATGLLTGDTKAPYWTDSVGHALIESASFSVGGQSIDHMKGEFLFIWEELSGAPGKRLSEMTGRLGTVAQLQRASQQARRLYVPLPFWFCLNSGLALPLISLQFHSVAVSLKLRDLYSLLKFPADAMAQGYAVNGTTKGIFVRNHFDPDARTEVQTVANGALAGNIGNNDLAGFVEVCYVYLDQRERSKFADGAFEQLMIEHQDCATQVNYTVSGVNEYGGADRKIQYEINFNHTVIELFWAVRMAAYDAFPGQNPTGTYGDMYNQWFKFDGGEKALGDTLYDPVRTIQLRLNNATRFGDVEGRYFRLVQPWQHHTNIPGGGGGGADSIAASSTDLRTVNAARHVYSYSFALQPEDVQPSGSCNFSRIDNTKLDVVLDRHMFWGPSSAGSTDANHSVTFMVFCTNWNIIRFKYGLGGKRFAN